jgi:MYXO-CTERM domain-containing protein
LAVLATIALCESRAEACGCLSPPAPSVDDTDYAVNQQAEQIIFEVEPEHIVAHVLIRYQGKPEKFAWIVPVPSQPELSLSNEMAFSLLDRETAPRVNVYERNVCPQSSFQCRYHTLPVCTDPDDHGGGYADAGASSAVDAASGGGTPVEIIDRQTIGSYDTIVFSAGDMQAAVAWLQQEGFIVNSTMAPYMQPYADTGNLFVASKLIPGADITEIKPLRMRFRSTQPMIPIQLTAVAAEPHMTITAYVYGDTYFQPDHKPLVTIDPRHLGRDLDGRTNYPMVLARTVDEAPGGHGFVAEYAGSPVLADFDQGTGCCSSGWDQCGIQWDGVCSCPGNPLDATDCADQTDLIEGAAMLEDLATKYTRLTRITTRLSAEDMTFDPTFVPLETSPVNGRLSLTNQVDTLDSCTNDILDPGRYATVVQRRACSSMYCGTGECVTTDFGAACDCDAGSIARQFVDYDGKPSVTCVPATPPVDLGAGGAALPDVCDGVSCGMGTCVDRGGVAACQCNPNTAASTSAMDRPVCRPIMWRTGGPGARNYTEEVETIPVCAPPPPSCGQWGWLIPTDPQRPGVQCVSSMPSADELEEPPAPTCADLGYPAQGDPSFFNGCSCRAGSNGRDLAGLGLLLLAVGMLLRPRRKRRGRH